LIAFAMATSSLRKPAERDHRLEGGLSNTIDALVLYERVKVDGLSCERNIPKYPGLIPLLPHFEVVRLTHDEEQGAYGSIEALRDHIQGSAESADLFRGHTEAWMTAECNGGYPYPSARWDDVEMGLPDDLKHWAQLLRGTAIWGAACVSLLRTFYYQSLQEMIGGDLLLDPWKGAFYDRDKGPDILAIFDEKVRLEFIERKKKWLGVKPVDFSCPLLTSYVLNKSNQWSDVIKITLDLRDSKEARSYRTGIQELRNAIESHDNVVLDEIITGLESAANGWGKCLGTPIVPNKRIKLSVPFINLGIDLDIPDRRLRKTTADKLLVFIHKLIRYA
jgi:hypothetical protein